MICTLCSALTLTPNLREHSVSHALAALLDRYESGSLSRRDVLGAVAALTLSVKLETLGIESVIRARGDTNELYLVDPDGIRIQLQDVRYRGGIGAIGDHDPK